MSVIEAPVKQEATESPVVEEVTAADVLEHAAALLGEYGWLQGDIGSKARGGFCALGAIRAAAGDLAADHIAAFVVLTDACGGNIPYYNNAPGRTKAEVVAKLREAAKAARA